MRTRLLTGMVVMALAGVSFGQAVPTAKAIMDEAQAVAAKEKKQVWVIFHASWCGWCKRLDKFMEVEENKIVLAKYFVPVHVTVLESEDKKQDENPGGAELMNALEGDNAGLPFFAFVDKDGKMIINSKIKKEPGDEGQNTGHPVDPHEIAWFMKMLMTAAPEMTDAERSVLETWLKNQKIS